MLFIREDGGVGGVGDVGAFFVHPAVVSVFRNQDTLFAGGEDAVIGGAGDDFAGLIDVAPLHGGRDGLIGAIGRSPQRDADAKAPVAMVMARRRWGSGATAMGRRAGSRPWSWCRARAASVSWSRAPTRTVEPVTKADADTDGDGGGAFDHGGAHFAFSNFCDAIMERIEHIVVCHEGGGAVGMDIRIAVDGLHAGEAFGEGGEDFFVLRANHFISFVIDEAPEFIFILHSRQAFAEGGRYVFVNERNRFFAGAAQESPEIFISFHRQKAIVIAGFHIFVSGRHHVMAAGVDDAPFAFLLHRREAAMEEASLLVFWCDFFAVPRQVAVAIATLHDGHAMLKV